MGDLRLTLACGPYDRTEALRTGIVKPEGIELTYLAIQSPPEIFARMLLRHEFDVAEMSCALYLMQRAKGNFPFVALPVFPSRMFRHGFIFINTRSGIRTPKDLEGRRIGVPEYRQTAAVWIRGILQHEYGVNLESIRWVMGGVNQPRRPDELDIPPNKPVHIEFVSDRTLNELLVNGEIDALIGARRPAALGVEPHVQRLFPNYRDVEREYYGKIGIFPIMHTLVMKESLYRERPWVATSLYKAFVQAKAWCLDQMQFSGTMRYMLPWLFHDLEEMKALFGGDPWPYGLEPNRKTLETLATFLLEQGFLREPVRVDELFVPIVLANE